jgi:hypothetical protein
LKEPLDAESVKVAKMLHEPQDALFVDVRLDILYPLILLVPPEAPLQDKVIVSLL